VILPSIPRPIRWTLRKLYFLPAELSERLLGRQEDLVPPKSANFVGAVDTFRRSGDILVDRLVGVAGLTPDARVLDVGCGIGRLAVALTRFNNSAGSYEGLDIVPGGIQWCTEHITPRYPSFRFTLADIVNTEYNPHGRVRAAEYVFPYPDDSFDLVVLASVFTHMLPADVEHYIAEITRVLRFGGRCFATFFLINEDASRRMEAGEGALHFRHHLDPHWVINPRVPEFCVGYDEPHVRALYERYGLITRHTIYYGGWCGRPPFWYEESGLGDHDVVLGTKV
jgi:ubiquinone/menaquinone biosynthesis C-methylase UbiE